MVVVLKYGVSLEDAQRIRDTIKGKYPGLEIDISVGEERTLLLLKGSAERMISSDYVAGIEGVETYHPVLKPYKLGLRESHPQDTVIKVGNVKIGSEFIVMAGPCSIEEKTVMMEIARGVKDAGGKIIRGGAFKPRTFPSDFRGLGEEGLVTLAEAGYATGLPTITEVMDASQIELVARYADILQVGARNSQNFTLLDALSRIDKPVLLKRGAALTFDEWLGSAEYLLLGSRNDNGEYVGNPNVMLCERGVKSSDPNTFRNTLDVIAVIEARSKSHLPVIADPSHGTGKRHLVVDAGLSAVTAGAHGLLVEAHYNPSKAKTDGAQTIDLKALEKLVRIGEDLYRLRREWDL